MSTITRYASDASSEPPPNDEISTRPLDETGLIECDPSSSQNSTWSQAIDDLLEIRNLEDDWDGQGGEAPDPTLVDGAIVLAQDLRSLGIGSPDRTVAGANGTVFFEWDNPIESFEFEWPGLVIYREIEVIAPNEAEVRWIYDGSDEAHERLLIFG